MSGLVTPRATRFTDRFAVTKPGLRLAGLAGGIGLTAFLVMAIGFAELTNQQTDAARWVDHTLEVVGAVETFQGDLEAGIGEGRGYLLFQEPGTEGMFEQFEKLVPQDIARLRALTIDNPRQQATLDIVAVPVGERLRRLSAIIARVKAEGLSAKAASGQERRTTNSLMAQIRSSAESLKAEERRLLALRRAAAQRATQWLWAAMTVFGIVAAASVACLLALQGTSARQRAHCAEQERLNEQLERLTRHLITARDKAEQANRAKTHFLAGMSHELRTPLNGILGYARLLRMDGGLTSVQATRVDAMLGAGKHLLHMIARVLDLSEIEADRVALQSAVFNPQAVASECIEVMRPVAEEKSLALRMKSAAGTPEEMVGDRIRLQQVLLNLLGNAVKFTSTGAVELTLRPAAGDRSLRIEIADTGPGIPDGQRARLFRDFERLDAAATRDTEGAGLGLSLSARLTQLMGGQIGHMARPGGGSIFWLELPFDPTLQPPDLQPSTEDVVASSSAKLHVLVVDDIFMNRDIAGSFLRAAGHSVTCVEGGEQAIEAVASTNFDVVLMDVRMPEMDGLEATRRIRLREGAGRRVPILALSAQAFTEQVAECRTAGMDGHLLKPFDSEALLAAVARAAVTGESNGDGRNAGKPGSAEPGSAEPGSAEPVEPAAPSIGADLPVFDPEAFDRTASFLPADKVAAYVHGIARDTEALLRALCTPGALKADPGLADAAHALAGSAGMLGFARVASVGRLFERAMRSGDPAARTLADGLIGVLEATLQAIRTDHMLTASASASMA